MDAQILQLKYFQGMTAMQIAQSLGLPYETVKKRHQRSLVKLRKYLTIGLVIAALRLCWQPAGTWFCAISAWFRVWCQL